MINIAETRELYMFILSMVSSVVYIQPAVNDKCPGFLFVFCRKLARKKTQQSSLTTRPRLFLTLLPCKIWVLYLKKMQVKIKTFFWCLKSAQGLDLRCKTPELSFARKYLPLVKGWVVVS